MKNMKNLSSYACLRLLSFHLQLCSNLVPDEDIDDFTDEVSYTLSFVDDSESGIFGFQCNNSQYLLNYAKRNVGN